MKIAIACFGLVTLASCPIFAQFQTDHFACYVPITVSQIQSDGVNLEDQFGTNAAVIGQVFRLCNPARKTHNGVVTPIQNPTDRLTLHLTGPQPLTTRQVRIQNQFGDQVLTTQDARILAVPTVQFAPLQGTDHFSCYTVSDGQAINEQVNLQDQWSNAPRVVRRPFLFCNPVRKGHNGVITPVRHPDDHLTCYTTSKQQVAPVSVFFANQFGPFSLNPRGSDMLCVPTRKIASQEAE